MDRVDQVEAELQVLKGQIKETLSDIEEYILTYADNPFAWNTVAPKGNGHRSGARIHAEADDVAGHITEGEHLSQSDRKDSTVLGDADPAQNDSFGTNGSGANQTQLGDRARSVGAESVDETGNRRLEMHDDERSPGTWPPLRGIDGNRTGGTNNDRVTEHPNCTEPANPRSARPRGLRSEDVDALIRWLTESREQPGPSGLSGQTSSLRSNSTPGEARHETVTGSPGSRAERPTEPTSEDLELGMDVIAVLGTWTAKALKRLGQPRLKNLLRLYAEIGGISPKTESILQSLADLEGAPACKEGVGLDESLRCLAELDDTVWRLRSKRPTTALLMSRLDDSSPAV